MYWTVDTPHDRQGCWINHSLSTAYVQGLVGRFLLHAPRDHELQEVGIHVRQHGRSTSFEIATRGEEGGRREGWTVTPMWHGAADTEEHDHWEEPDYYELENGYTSTDCDGRTSGSTVYTVEQGIMKAEDSQYRDYRAEEAGY